MQPSGTAAASLRCCSPLCLCEDLKMVLWDMTSEASWLASIQIKPLTIFKALWKFYLSGRRSERNQPPITCQNGISYVEEELRNISKCCIAEFLSNNRSKKKTKKTTFFRHNFHIRDLIISFALMDQITDCKCIWVLMQLRDGCHES